MTMLPFFRVRTTRSLIKILVYATEVMDAWIKEPTAQQSGDSLTELSCQICRVLDRVPAVLKKLEDEASAREEEMRNRQ